MNNRNRWGWTKAAIIVCFLVVSAVPASSAENPADNQKPAVNTSGSFSEGANGSRRLNIQYGNLVDRHIYTHSGKTVGDLLDITSNAGDAQQGEIYANLQPYLEPFSFVNNYITAVAKSDDAMPHLTVVADYRPGLRQPAWAALFREGNYQLFVGDGRARLFLKGTRPEKLYEQYFGVVRHPLREALFVLGLEKMNVEVYAFENSYASQTIRLDLRPYVLEVQASQLSPRVKSLPLAGLETFFEEGVVLEAAEINGDDHFYLYGKPSSTCTIADRPQSLEDFAVVYRAFFHHGYNAPYISLDRAEDNRYAKVNFGGLLEDTHIGYVVLEADKLFKTMSTGLDPNTRQSIKGKILKDVPGFLTEDERELNHQSKSERMQIRYWFYPSKIRCVTDGRIGVIQNSQFLADAERSDKAATLDQAQRDTIDHLNNNLTGYAQALSAYRELDAVSRMMALMVWLQQNSSVHKVDFDDLLSVELSAFKTQCRTKKLVAVTAESYILAADGGRTNAKQKVCNVDVILDGLSPTASDGTMLDMAGERFGKVDEADLIPSVNASVETNDMKDMKMRLDALEAKIESERTTIDRNSSSEIKRFNDMVAEYNALGKVYDDAVAACNASQREIRYKIRRIASVAGGINLRPKDFAQPLIVNPSSPLIQKVKSSPDTIRSSQLMFVEKKKKSQRGPGSTITALQIKKPWQRHDEVSDGDIKKIKWTNTAKDRMSAELNAKTGYVRHQVKTKEYSGEMILKPGRKEMVILASEYPAEIIATGDFSEGGTVILRRGKALE